MKKIVQIITLAVLGGLTACSDGSGVGPLPVAETTVRLAGAIGVSTRAVIGSGYEKDLAVSFARQDETAVGSGAYGAWSLCKATRKGGKGNRPIVFADLQLYPDDGRNIRLQGYYPASGEGVTSDEPSGRIVFTIDGATDIMATGTISGNTNAPLTTCTFQHLLTHIQLACHSDCADKWGSVVKVEAAGVHREQELALSSGSPALAAVASPTEKNIAFPGMAAFELPPFVEGEVPEAQGAVLLPVLPAGGTEANPLRLLITTTKDGWGREAATVSEVAVWVEGGFRTGKRHLISLLFSDGCRISPTSVSVEAWTEQDANEIPI